MAFDKQDAIIRAILQEHSSLRAEVIFSLGQRAIVGSYGLAAISLLTAASVASLTQIMEHKFLFAPPLLMCAFIPIICQFTLFLWNNETKRIRKASQHLQHIETKINSILGDNTMSWEITMRTKAQKYNFSPVNYVNAIFYTFFGFISTVAGSYYLYLKVEYIRFPYLYMVAPIIVAYAIIFLLEVRKSRDLILRYATPLAFPVTANAATEI